MKQGSEKMIDSDVIASLPVAAYTTDAGWKVVAFNDAAAELTGLNAKDAVGMRIRDIFNGAIGKKGCKVMDAISLGRAIEVKDIEFVNNDEVTHIVTVSARPITDGAGNIIGSVGFMIPQASAGTGSNGNAFLNGIPTPVMAVDSDLKITFMNQAALKMVGKSLDQVLGTSCHLLMNTDHCKGGNCAVRKSMSEDRPLIGDTHAHLQSGEMPIRCSVAPVKDESGKVVGAIELITDITKETEITKEVKRLTEEVHAGNLKARVDASKFEGNYKSIVDGMNETIDTFMKPLKAVVTQLGYMSKGDLSKGFEMEVKGDLAIMRDRLDLCQNAIKALVDDTKALSDAAAKGDFSKRADASKHQGEYANVISGFNQTLDLVVDKTYWYEQIIDALPFPLSVTDANMRMTYLNRASLDILKKPKSELLGQNCQAWNGQVCGTKDCGIMRLRHGQSRTMAERNGKTNQIDVSYLKNAKGEVVGHVEILQDVTKTMRKIKYEQVEVERVAKGLEMLAVGDLTFDTKVGDADEYTQDSKVAYEQIMNNLVKARDAIRALVKDTNALSRAAIQGRLDERANLSQHGGNYKMILDGVNHTLDSVVGDFESIPTPIQFMDKDLRIMYINEAGAKLLGKSKKDLMGMKCADLWNTSKCKTAACPCSEAMRIKGVHTCENDCTVGGNHMDIFCAGAPLKNDAGEVIGAFEFVTDQTAMKQMIKKSQKVSSYQVDSANAIKGVLEEMADGDLTASIELHEADMDTKEAYELFHEVHMAIRKLRLSLINLLTEVNNSVDMVSSTSQELASSAEEMNASTEQVSAAIQQISRGAQNQAAQVDETAKVMAEMASSVETVSSKSESARTAATSASEGALRGKDTVDATIKKMQEIAKVVEESAAVITVLGKRSEEIGEIVDVITNISDQTNLLALNAAIEAARAGEQGRGFAVVAEEVKNLAEDSREAAERIAKMIKEVQQETGKAVEAMHRGTKEAADGIQMVDNTGKAFSEISDAIARTADEASDIAQFMVKQKDGAQRAAKSVDGIASIAEETASSAEESASSTQELTASMEDLTARAQTLSEMAVNLQRVSEQFKIGSEQERVEEPLKPVAKAAPRPAPAEPAPKSKANVPVKVKEALAKRGIEAQ
ncbi:MAG: PAS domain-containing protein [Methanomassiliicoccus sp.]|nr:PAS domain-containing protein [Methanomassiliicoccus sp.]